MRELGRLCRAYCSESHKSWGYHLPKFARLLNLVEHESTGKTPGGLQTGERPDKHLRKLLKLPATTRPSRRQTGAHQA
jgi:hypothetical protein